MWPGACPPTPTTCGRFVRAVRNEPDEAARQIRSLLGSALQTTSADFDLASLVNTDPNQVRIGAFEDELRRQVDSQLYQAYGVHVVQVGIEHLTLPAVTLSATVERMRAERETVAAQRTADGKRQAAQIRSDADRDARHRGRRCERQSGADRSAVAQRCRGNLWQQLRGQSASLHDAALARHARLGGQRQYEPDSAHRCRAVPGAGAGPRPA